MLVEFYSLEKGVFKLDIPLPLPPIYRVPMIPPTVACSFKDHEYPPPTPKMWYIEFELAIIKTTAPFAENVIGLPRKAYKEKRKER